MSAGAGAHRSGDAMPLPPAGGVGTVERADCLAPNVPINRTIIPERPALRRPPSPPRLPAAALDEPVWFARSVLKTMPTHRLPVGCGPAGTFASLDRLVHPFAQPITLHPLYERALRAQALPLNTFRQLVLGRMAFWDSQASRLREEREVWLASLPEHARVLHTQTGLHGPLLLAIHKHLVARGYPDISVASHASNGFPAGGELPRSCLWHSDPSRKQEDLHDLSSCCLGTAERVQAWAQQRAVNKDAAELLNKHLASEAAGREREVTWASIKDSERCLVHPCFLLRQGGKAREIMDCTAGMLNLSQHSAEKLPLPGIEDVADFAARLRCQLGKRARIAVADEKAAFRNWPNAEPNLHVAAVFGCPAADNPQQAFRCFLDYALTFGDASAVYAYNRVRFLVTAFLVYEFFIPVWSFYDDSALALPDDVADLLWFVFLKVHVLLQIPIKGNPLDSRCASDDTDKLRIPRAANKFLGEIINISRLPISISPTPERVRNCKMLLSHILASGRLSPAVASMLAGKLRFLSGSLHCRVGIPGLAPLYRRQKEEGDRLHPPLRAGLRWLAEIIAHVGPRTWHWGSEALPVWSILGDASEPADQEAPRICAAILRGHGAHKFEYFAIQVPSDCLRAFIPRAKQIGILEMLWVFLALCVWRRTLRSGCVTAFEDNSGAERGIIRGMSKHEDLNCLLALIWGTAAQASLQLWADRVASADNPADCLTKSGLDRSHLQDAVNITDCINWKDIFGELRGILAGRRVPSWSIIQVFEQWAVQP